MPGVVALAGASFLGALGIGAASAGVIMATGYAVIALGVASVRRASQLKDPGEIDRPTGTTVSFASTEMPANIAFGETLVGGVWAYVNSRGSELRELYYEIVHTGHEIDSYIGWYLDEKYVPVADVDVAGDGSVDTNTGGHGLDDVSGTPTLYLRGALGTDSQAVDSMLDSAFAEIDTNHRHRGCARSVVRCDLLQGHEDKWNGRSPQSITAVIRAAKCYDPRLDSTFPGGVGAHRLATPSTWAWTDNPPLQWARYRAMAAPLGPGWATDRINWQAVFDAANVCDALVAVPTAATEKRFRCDLVVDSSMEPREVIAKILATMGGKERQINGLWNVYAAAWPSTDFALTDDDLIGEVQYLKQPDAVDRYNQVKGSFFDRNRLWKRTQFVTVNNTTLRTNRDGGEVLPLELDLDGVTREYQAQRLAMHALNHADDTGILIFPTGYNGLNTRIGDTGTVSLDPLGMVAKTFRCVGVRFIEFQGAELTLKEDSSGNYSDPAEGAYSTRTAAGDIVFGTVLPWYLEGPPVIGWVADSQGKPAGVREVFTSGVPDRSTIALVGNCLDVTATTTSGAAGGTPAIPVSDATSYRIRLRYRVTVAATSCFTLKMYELAAALPSGKTHVGSAAATSEAVVEESDSTVDLITAGTVGTAYVTETYTYTPTSGTKFVTIAFLNNTPSVNTHLQIEWVGMTEVGRNVNLLPGVRPPGDTADLVPEAATSPYTLTDADQTNIPDIFFGSYQLQFPSAIDEAHDCEAYATFTCQLVAPSGAYLAVKGYVNGVAVPSSQSQFLAPVTSGTRVSMQFQLSVAAGQDWNVFFQAGGTGAVDADLTDIRWEVNVIRR